MRALNPDIPALMQKLRASGVPALGSVPPEIARLNYKESRKMLQPVPYPVAEISDLVIPHQDAPLRARLYRGVQTGSAQPCLVFLHGGGWVLGSIESHEGICRQLASEARCCVLSLEYRLAPEHPYPAALQDGMLALRWLAEQAGMLGIDAARIAVGGDSAGGNLAAVLALLGRDGDVPHNMFQMLFYPATDLTMEDADAGIAADIPLNADAMRYFIGHYVPRPEDRLHWHASPLRAASLAGAPPAFVLTCGHDPLCRQGQLYAARLEQEGVPVKALHLSDQAHGILNLGKVVHAAQIVLSFAAMALGQAFK